jgi:ribosomal protein S18 acetylase RimI-like enzyme
VLRVDEWQTVRDALWPEPDQRQWFQAERSSTHADGSFHLTRLERDKENRPVLLMARVWAGGGQVQYLHVTAQRPGPNGQEALLIASMHGGLARLRDLRVHTIGKGLGSICLRLAEELFVTHGVREVTGWLSDADYESRPRQVHFYEKNGYNVMLTGKTGTVRKRFAPEPQAD